MKTILVPGHIIKKEVMWRDITAMFLLGLEVLTTPKRFQEILIRKNHYISNLRGFDSNGTSFCANTHQALGFSLFSIFTRLTGDVPFPMNFDGFLERIPILGTR